MATVGTAKVTIEADFSKFDSDMKAFFGQSGAAAGKALDKGVKSGADAAKKSVSEVGKEFSKVESSASTAGRSVSGSWARDISGVGTSTKNTVKVASDSLSSLSSSGSSSARKISTNWSSGIAGVGSSTRSAANSASSSLSGVASSASSSANRVRVSFASGLSSVSSAASSMRTSASASLGAVASRASEAAGSIRKQFSEAFNSAERSALRIPSAITGIAVAAAAAAGPMAMLKGGFDRLMNIQRAEIMFKSVGLSADQTKEQMARLTEQVTGTSVSLSDAAKYSAMFAQAGVEMGKPMDDAISAFTSLSAISAGSGVDVGRVLQQMSAAGKVTAEDMNQLADAGVNSAKYLADSMGIPLNAVKDLASEGGISFEDFVTAINKGTGSLAKDMGQTLPAKISNFKTALSSLGAAILAPFMGPAATVVSFFTDQLKTATGAVKEFVSWLQGGSAAAQAAQVVIGGVAAAIGGALALMALSASSALGGLIVQFAATAAASVANGWAMVVSAGKTIAAWAGAAVSVAVSVGQIIAGWVLMAATSVAQATVAAGAWLVAAPANLWRWTVAFGEIVAGWAMMAASSLASAGRAAVAWLIAAPKNPIVWAQAFAAIVAGWASTAVSSLASAGRIALAWIIATPGNLVRMTIAFGTMVAGWVSMGVTAMAQAAVIAGAWLISMWPVALVIAAVLGVVLVFKTLWDKVEGFRNFFTGMWEGVKTAVSGAWTFIRDTIVGIWDGLVAWFRDGGAGQVWESIKGGAQSAWDTIVTIWNGAVQFFSDVFGGIWANMQTAWDGISAAFLWVWENVLSPVYTWISDTWGKLVEVIGPVWDTITAKISAFGTWFMEFWNGTIWPMLSGVIDWFQRIGSAIGTFIAEHWSVLKPALILLGTVLLAPIVIALGLVVAAIAAVVLVVGLVVGAITGFIYVLVSLPGWIMGVVRAIGDWFGRAWQWTKAAFSNMGRAISDWWNRDVAPLPGRVGGALSSVGGWFKRLPGIIWDAVKGAGSWLLDTGKNIVQGLMDGMGSMAGKIGSWFLDKIPGWIKAPFKAALGIHSPSRVFAGYGVNIGEGLIQGVRSMRGAVKSSTQDLAAEAANVTMPSIAGPEVGAAQMGTPAAMSAPVAAPVAPVMGAETAAALTAAGGLFETQQVQMGEWALAAQTQTQTVVNPAFDSVGTTLTNMNATVFQPTMTAMQTGLASTGLAAQSMNLLAWQPAMAGMQAAAQQTGANTQWNAYGVMNPALQSIASTAWGVLNGGVNPAMAGIRGALQHTANSFGWAAGNIATQWNQVREATARPVRFAIQSVFNDGIVGMWNSASELLGTKRMGTYPVRFKTGGYVRGPGGPKDDKIPALLSDKEFVINAAATKKIGPENLAALNSGNYNVAPGVLRNPRERKAMMQDKTFQNVASRYQGGGLATGTPAWKALLRGYNWARSRNGRPYVWGGSANGSGGTDCSGYMSGIANVILGGDGGRQWATMSFPGNQQGAWKPGLSAGFSVGISDPHTAGTIGGVPGMPAVNVESGGINSRVKFGTPDAAGANDPQFNRRFSMIVTDGGAFKPGMGGGASMADVIGSLTKPYQDKMRSASSAFAAQNPGLFGSYPKTLSETLGKITRDKIAKLTEEMSADPGGAGAERWRPMAKRAMARVGFDWQNPAQVNAMIAQIASESGGDPNRAQEIVDVNGTGESAGLGLLQIIPGTFAAHRDPALPNDRRNPFANMVAALRYYRATYGMDLTTMWGHGHGYHLGGVASEGAGWIPKTAKGAERVLSPRQTASFEELVGFLGSTDWKAVTGGGSSSGMPVSGGSSTRTVEVRQNFYGPVDADMSAEKIEDKLTRSAW